MKINLPVTNNEYVLKEADSIVSRTDTKGIITYINGDFLRVSGFTDLGIASSQGKDYGKNDTHC
jgi:methyl-accepting chemotaxis protein